MQMRWADDAQAEEQRVMCLAAAGQVRANRDSHRCIEDNEYFLKEFFQPLYHSAWIFISLFAGLASSLPIANTVPPSLQARQLNAPSIQYRDIQHPPVRRDGIRHFRRVDTPAPAKQGTPTSKNATPARKKSSGSDSGSDSGRSDWGSGSDTDSGGDKAIPTTDPKWMAADLLCQHQSKGLETTEQQEKYRDCMRAKHYVLKSNGNWYLTA
ncbi:hypothetical protein C8J56DRAFT_893127 [Mycena floridula]|nr:hypothetical protein C8J56DRAFT_893127 [Mycena floridula]